MTRFWAAVLTIAFDVIIAAAHTKAAVNSPIGSGTEFVGDIPPNFISPTQAEDYVKRDVMISMRDGVNLHTVIVIPKGVKNAPIILNRTPYGASSDTSHSDSPRRDLILSKSFGELADHGYIIVVQDVRGKFGSEGIYVVNRPLSGPLNSDKVDDSTDAYDTIDWLVKHVPEANGRVATMGTSYDGFTVLMSLIAPHPALKAAVPFNPMVDTWKGDDWFHNGALRETYAAEYAFQQTSSKFSDKILAAPRYDAYETWLSAGSADAMGHLLGLNRLPFWERLESHPAYDSYWQNQAFDRILAYQPLTVPTLHVHSQWDQEDIYGAPAVYAAMEAKNVGHDKNFLVIGPWLHGGGNHDGSGLGPLRFHGDTGLWFRQNVLLPFLDANLKAGSRLAKIAPATVYETGANVWRRYKQWPQSCAQGCPNSSEKLYLIVGNGLSFQRPDHVSTSYD